MSPTLEIVPQHTAEPQSEHALVARAAGGDEQAFRALYEATVDRIHALLLRITSSRMLAEDLTQETYVRAWRGLDRYRGDAAFLSWLHTIAVRVSIESHRRARTREEREVDWPEAPPGVTGAPSTVARIALERAIAELPEGARTVFVLYQIEGYRHAEIAEMLDVATPTVRSQLHRARKLLREAIDR